MKTAAQLVSIHIDIYSPTFILIFSTVKLTAIAAILGLAAAKKKEEFVFSEFQNSTDITVVQNNTQPGIPYANIWSDEEGKTHVEHCKIEGLEFASYAPPAGPQWIGLSPDHIESISYAALPVGYVGTWHHAPGPQWVITLSGKWSVETDEGTVVNGPGEMQFNSDSGAHKSKDNDHVGHVSRTVGNEPNVQLIIKLKSGHNPQAKGRCAF